jgi:DUF917 family protein
MLKLAIDVGGTNTDAVLLEQDLVEGAIKILARVKIATLRSSVTDSVMSVIDAVLSIAECAGHKVIREKINIHLGTTHFANALRQREELEKVALIRLALPASDFVPPFFSWPQGKDSLLNSVYGYSAIVHGGCEADGKILAKLSYAELTEVAECIKVKRITRVVLSAPNSPTHPQIELAAKKILREMLPNNVIISMSHTFPEGGILERENAAILNAALLGKAQAVFTELNAQLIQRGLTSPLFVTRNDGSFMMVEEAITKPLLAYSSGQINSIRGAGMLGDFHDALVVDIGGTTTDVGLLQNNSPHMTNLHKQEEGVEFIIDCAHHNTIALGGGSIITLVDNEINLLKYSLQHHVTISDNQKLPFYLGGEIFTLTDLALILNRMKIENINNKVVKRHALARNFSEGDFERADFLMHESVAAAIDETRISRYSLPIILCGGGASLIDTSKLTEALRFEHGGIFIPQNGDVANAIGASGATVRIKMSFDFDGNSNGGKVNARICAKKAATKKAILCGAALNSIRIVSELEQEYSYSHNSLKKLTLVVEGKLAKSILENESTILSGDENEEVDETYISQEDFEELIQLGHHDNPPLAENPITAIRPNHVRSLAENTHILTEEEINYFAIGSGYLGSGGGGDVRLAKIAALSSLRNGKPLTMIRDINKLSEDDYVVVIGYMGMPEVVNEKLASRLSGPIVIENIKNAIEKKMGRSIKMAGVAVIEIGGANGLFSGAQAASAGLPMLDLDAMGRAFPSILMSSTHIDGEFDDHIIVLAKEDEKGNCIEIHNKTLQECEKEMFRCLEENGGAMFAAMMPVTVKQAKMWCIQGTITTAIEIGRRVSLNLRDRKSIVQSLNEALVGTNYGSCELIINGAIISINRHSDHHHNFGEIIVKDSMGNLCEIFYKNENLVAIKDGKIVVLTPDLITIVNPDTGQAIGSSSDYHVGLRVEVIKIGSPRYFLNPNGTVRERAKMLFGCDKIKILAQESSGLEERTIFSQSQHAGGMTHFQPAIIETAVGASPTIMPDTFPANDDKGEKFENKTSPI